MAIFLLKNPHADTIEEVTENIKEVIQAWLSVDIITSV